jgi:hypothetical protein
MDFYGKNLFLENLLFNNFKTSANCAESYKDIVCFFAALAFLTYTVIFLLYFSMYGYLFFPKTSLGEWNRLRFAGVNKSAPGVSG